MSGLEITDGQWRALLEIAVEMVTPTRAQLVEDARDSMVEWGWAELDGDNRYRLTALGLAQLAEQGDPPGSVEVYSQGLIALSVCAWSSMDQEQVEEEANLLSPTGISSRWRVADEKFLGGLANPHKCERDSERRHWLLHC